MTAPSKIACISLVIVLSLCGLGYYLSTQLIAYSTHTQLLNKPIFNTKPYLAAQLFLQKKDRIITTANDLNNVNQLPPNDQAVILLGQETNHLPTDTLLSWIQNGGNLILGAGSVWNKKRQQSNNPLLDQLGIHVISKKIAREKPSDLLTELYIDDDTPPALINLDPTRHLEDTLNKAYIWANANNHTTHILQLAYGKGLITVLSDTQIWNNQQIDLYDNAWLLDYLTPYSHIELILPPAPLIAKHTTLIASLLTYYPLTIVLLIAITLFFIGSKTFTHLKHWRSLQPSPNQLSPTFFKKLAYSLLKQSGKQALISQLQQHIYILAKQHHPHFSQLSVEEQWGVLSHFTKQPIATLSKSMRPLTKQQTLSTREFIQIIINLQTIRNCL